MFRIVYLIATVFKIFIVDQQLAVSAIISTSVTYIRDTWSKCVWG